MEPIDDDQRARIRKTWRRLAPVLKITAALGLSARMSAAEAAEANFELIDVLCEIAADYEQIRCPVTFVVASGRHFGSGGEEPLRKMRAGINPIVESRPNVTIFATVPASHTQVLARHPDTIASAIASVAKQARRTRSTAG